jgi:polysaccharide deacetylase 2 family uncharacterized protein YibQ
MRQPIAIRRQRARKRQLSGFAAPDVAFALVLGFAVLVGGKDALSSLPRLFVGVFPQNLMAAEASVGGPASEVVLILHPNAMPESTGAPHVLSPLKEDAARIAPSPANVQTAPPLGGSAVAIVIDDLGLDLGLARAAIALPSPVALAFLPYGDDAPALAHAAAKAGHEVLAHVPMEALGGADPGPMALRADLPPSELVRRLDWALARLPDAAGINNHMGSRLTIQRGALVPIVERLAERNMFFLDSRTTAASQVVDVARAFGVASAARKVFLDDVPSPAAIEGALEALARCAKHDGVAIAIGHARPLTLDRIAAWTREAKADGVQLVTLRAAIRLETERAVEKQMANSE